MRICLTGANGALGRVVHAALLEAGDQVVGLAGENSVATSNLDLIIAGDLSDPDQARAAVETAARRIGGFDALVHLAGAFRWLPVAQSSPDDWRALYTANVESAVCTIQAAMPHLAQNASIVLVGAHSAQVAGAGMAPYAAAKSGVARLAEALSVELRPAAVRVNAILPSIIDTPTNRRDMPEADFTQWTSPAAIADTIRFLASPASRAVNGALLPVINPSV